MIVPNQSEYTEASGGSRAYPLHKDILADLETPVSAYWKLAHDQTYSFLLESVTGGEQLARYSILGVRPRKVVRTKNQSMRTIEGDIETDSEIGEGQDPLDILAEELSNKNPKRDPSVRHFLGGAVGMMAYDVVRFFEKLPDTQLDDLQIDDMAMMICDTVVVFDHAKNLIRILVMADGTEAGYQAGVAEIEWVESRLSAPLPVLPINPGTAFEVTSNVTQDEYEQMVKTVKGYIAQGDGVQMVPSQRFKTKCEAHPITVYRALRSVNPSPYMFILRFGDFDLVGASPELMVSLHDRKARVRLIAGTRWRGATEEEDARLADELINDEKERAEHVMLVDLGRNDLGRVSDWGSVTVNELMVIEKYSHVMHITSDVTGNLRSEFDGFDLIRAAFPAGTVSGAPKVRAMEIIDELEPTRRGSYAGSVGMIGYGGDVDTCITLRTILIKDGFAYVQAGGGVVYDSDPTAEFVETKNKARAALRAIEIAHTGF